MKMIEDMPAQHEDLEVGDFVVYSDRNGKEHGIIIEKGENNYQPFVRVFWIEAGTVIPYSPPYFLFSRLSK